MAGPMRYTIVIERSPRNYSAYVPDLPGCVATGASEAEVIRGISEAIRYHIESLCEHHEPVPEPNCTSTVIDVVALAG
ncbi:MAG: type II toxin-antitoxin system HicB family antitoxin [Bryobacterales bacterium]|nr:type II toxin-antitoxin system HicB family antitoxin [Bryobacterales bacterium]